MTTALKIYRRKKSSKRIQVKISTHNTGETTQVTTSFKIKTKLTKKAPPLKMTAHKKLLKMRTWSNQKI